MTELALSPLNDFHVEHGARMVPFAGWSMPVQYASIIEEHLATRGYAGLFDVSHMGEVLVHGDDAEAFLDWLLTNQVEGMKDGRAVYSPMCREDGGVVDDVIAMRLNRRRFLLVVNASNHAKDVAWISEQAQNYHCEVADVSAHYALLALQGPLACDILQRVMNPLHEAEDDAVFGSITPTGSSGSDLRHLKRFHFWDERLGDIPVIISRTGYTGENGYEIFCPPDRAEAVAEKIMEVGVPIGLLPCGLGARDSLRLEAGLPLYGNELSDNWTPLHAAIDWTVKFTKKDFCGKQALEKLTHGGLKQRLVHFIMEGRRIARSGTPVLSRGTVCGKVLSGCYSPVLERPVGSAMVAVSAMGGPLHVDLRGHETELRVANPPLHLAEI